MIIYLYIFSTNQWDVLKLLQVVCRKSWWVLVSHRCSSKGAACDRWLRTWQKPDAKRRRTHQPLGLCAAAHQTVATLPYSPNFAQINNSYVLIIIIFLPAVQCYIILKKITSWSPEGSDGSLSAALKICCRLPLTIKCCWFGLMSMAQAAHSGVSFETVKMVSSW